MGEPTLSPMVQFVCDMYRIGDQVADWDIRAAVDAAALGFEVTTSAVYAEVLDAEMPHHDRSLVYAIARDGDDLDIQRRCASAEDPFVRELCARNPSVPAEVLAELAKDPSALVRMQVARNPNVGDATLELLSKDPSYVGFEASWELRKRRGPALDEAAA